MDLFQAAAERDRQIRVVGENAGPVWLDLAVAAIRAVAEKQPTLTSDDVWARGLPEPSEPRAMGAAFVRARAEGIVERTGLTRASDRGTNNARHLRVWASRLYRPNDFERTGREDKALAIVKALYLLDRDLPGARTTDEPLSERVADLSPAEWEFLTMKLARRAKAPSDACVLRVIEILREHEGSAAA